MATLNSVNVGMPRDVSWHGRTVHTGVWKRPVDGPRTVRRLNIDGDGQGDLGGHGGENRAVLVYQTESYRHWSEHLRRDDLEPGHFGENFTVDGLPDDEVCIGDRYRIGTAVFEVTQPRVTCYRVGLRMNEPQMAALLVSHRRPGFYLRVIEEGEVEAGQNIVKIASGPEAVSVAEIDALLYLPGHPRDALERALRIPALSPGWKGSLRSLLDQADTGAGGNTGLTRTAGSPPPAWAGFRALTVTGMHAESRDVLSLRLAAADGTALPSWRAGQSVTLRVHPGDGATLIRSYSLSNRPGAAEYRISVKREPHGAAGRYLHSRVRVGDTLEVAAPRGTFFLDGAERPVVLVSAGVGVTPVLSMLYALAEADSTRSVWWVHGARDGSEHAFADESRDLLRRLSGSSAHIAYSRPADTDRKGVDYATAGRLSAELIGSLGLPHDADAYLCGPASFMADLGSALAGHGLDPARIHVETFGAEGALNPGVVPSSSSVAPHPPPGSPGAGPAVSFARSGLTVPWDPGRGTLLELAEACDVPTRWSCRTGVCHTCETALLFGPVDYDPEPVERPAEGNTLICCTHPADDVVLDL
ncbi:MOSC domain-containing protein [Rhodococcus sp. WS4]|nr:MOSC domain-containing protein [Rhodococcus sp. WS4]